MVQARYPGLAAGIETTASWTLLKARRHRAWRHATPLRGNPGRVGRRSAGVEAQQDHRRDLAESRARDPVRPFPFDLHKDHGETFHALSVAWRTSSPTGCKIKSVYCYEVGSRRHTGTHRTSRPASCRTLGLTSPRTSRLNCARSRATRADCARCPTPALSPSSARSQCGAARSRASRRRRRSSAASADLVRQSTVDTTNRWYDVQPFALAMQVLAERLIYPHLRPPLRR